MEYFDFSKEHDRINLERLFKDHFTHYNFVPFFGSGFSKGESTRRGIIPDVSEFKNFMATLICKTENYGADDRKELLTRDFANLGEIFWESFNKNISENNKDLTKYLMNNFINTQNITEAKKKLLNCQWRYIYTLNYDDLIESVFDHDPDLSIIIPYLKINEENSECKMRVYKIHGDAIKYRDTGDSNFLIISKRQYLEMLSSEENSSLNNNLQTDLASNNIIFFGCSLVDELDLVLANGLSKNSKIRQDMHSYYVCFYDDKHKKPNKIRIQELGTCGVTDIIYVEASLLMSFYQFIADISNCCSQNNNNKLLKKYECTFLEKNDRDSLKYLIMDNNLQECTITLPPFFVSRDIVSDIVYSMNKEMKQLYVVRGSHFSGKTYILYDLVNRFKNRKLAFYKSGSIVSNEILEELSVQKEALVLFDDDSLTFEQINMCRSLEMLNRLRDNNTIFVIAIDRSIGTFTKHFFEDYEELRDYISINCLESSFSQQEKNSFNEVIGGLGLINYKSHSILDYILATENRVFEQSNLRLPAYINISLFKEEQQIQLLILFILLANQNFITISESIALRINSTIIKYCGDSSNDISKVIQLDYLTESEKHTDTHDNFRIICNSKYWLYHCLAYFVDSPVQYTAVVKAYERIVSAFKQLYYNSPKKSMRKEYYKKIKPYYFLDAIQLTFFGASKKHNGSLSLCEKIYTALMPLLNSEYQFMHQRAKCLLRKSRHIKNKNNMQEQCNETILCLNEALQELDRAVQLAQDGNARNSEFTLFHMQVTKVLILVNELKCYKMFKHSLPNIDNLLDEYRKMLDDFGYNIVNEDFDEQEIKDLRWFNSFLQTEKIDEITSSRGIKNAKYIINHSKSILY